MEPGVKWTNLPLYSDVKNDGEEMQDLKEIVYSKILTISTTTF